MTRDGINYVKQGQTYPVAHSDVPAEVIREAGELSHIRAVWDREPKRPPREGEYYLSGAIVEAYRAPPGLTQFFHIAKLVEVEVQKRYAIKRFIPQEDNSKKVAHIATVEIVLAGEEITIQGEACDAVSVWMRGAEAGRYGVIDWQYLRCGESFDTPRPINVPANYNLGDYKACLGIVDGCTFDAAYVARLQICMSLEDATSADLAGMRHATMPNMMDEWPDVLDWDWCPACGGSSRMVLMPGERDYEERDAFDPEIAEDIKEVTDAK